MIEVKSVPACLACAEPVEEGEEFLTCVLCRKPLHVECNGEEEEYHDDCPGDSYLTESELLEEELDRISEALVDHDQGLGAGLFTRLFGGGDAKTKAAIEALDKAKALLRSERARLEKAREEADNYNDDAQAEVAKAATAIKVRAQEVKHEYALATQAHAAAMEGLTRIDKAQAVRDEAVCDKNTLRSMVLGLARGLGCPLRKADELAAMQWLLDNATTEAKEKKKGAGQATGFKLLLAGHVAELEDLAAEAKADGRTEVAEAFGKLASQWKSPKEG